MIVEVRLELSIAHKLREAASDKCRDNVHGHNYEILVGFEMDRNEVLNSVENVVEDFGRLKSILKEELDSRFDHSVIVSERTLYQELKDKVVKIWLFGLNATAEVLAFLFASLIKNRLEKEGKDYLQVRYVSVKETDCCRAIWRIEDGFVDVNGIIEEGKGYE